MIFPKTVMRVRHAHIIFAAPKPTDVHNLIATRRPVGPDRTIKRRPIYKSLPLILAALFADGWIVEAVADAKFGEQDLRPVRIGLDFLPQFAHENP